MFPGNSSHGDMVRLSLDHWSSSSETSLIPLPGTVRYRMDKVVVSGCGYGIARHSTLDSSGDRTCTPSGLDGAHARACVFVAKKIRGIGTKQIFSFAKLVVV